MAGEEADVNQLTNLRTDHVLHVTLETARRVERAEIEFCALAGSSSSRDESSDRGGIDILDSGGGRALFSKSGSPLNKVLGLGLQGRVSDEDLDRIEAFYRARNVPTQIELCPLAYSDIAARLCVRGYVLEAFENELGRRVGPVPWGDENGIRTPGSGIHSTDPYRPAERGLRIADFDPEHSVRVTLATADQDDLWTRVVSEGFVAAEANVGGGPATHPLTIEQMIEMMSQFAHPNIRRYLAWIEDEPAGGGAAWAYGGVLGIFGTSTMPRFRRRGVQSAVTIAAMNDGRETADLAVATTAPGSTSQRTFERLGFRVLYTRAIFIKS
jgi:hypothetical protein